jgi:hypothetical protein
MMKPIPQELIDVMPTKVEATRESCQATVDPVLLVLFLLGGQLKPPPESTPPIISNGHELWPLPAKWHLEEDQTIPLLTNLNGTGQDKVGYLETCKRNAQEYNQALEDSKPDVAIGICNLWPADSAHIWEYLNALACSVEKADIYRTLTLSPETKQAYYLAIR